LITDQLAIHEESAQVFLTSRERCFERFRLARFGETVTCVHCESDEVVKRGTTGKDAQQYWCKDCETYFNDPTDTIFGQHRFELEEMFYIVKEMRSEQTAQITRDLDRDYEAAVDFVHEVQETSDNIDEFALSEVCEADEVYVTAIYYDVGCSKYRIRFDPTKASQSLFAM